MDLGPFPMTKSGCCAGDRAEMELRIRAAFRRYGPLRLTMSRTILIADTNPSVREVLRHILMLRGFEVVGAGDGADALAVARETRIVAAVLDLHLPGRSGLDVCRELRAAHPGLPVWITSAGCHPATTLRARAAGALRVLRKPLRPTDVCRQIERELSRMPERRLATRCA